MHYASTYGEKSLLYSRCAAAAAAASTLNIKRVEMRRIHVFARRERERDGIVDIATP